MPRPRIPKESPVFDEIGRWTRTWIMYFESLFDLSVAEAVRLAATKQGEPGLSTSVFPYRADTTSTTAADPGKGKVRWNNATQASATNLYFDWLTSAGFDITALMEVMDAPDHIIIQDTDLALNHQVWELTGPVVMMPDWFQVPVTFVSSSGAGVFAHNQPVSVLVPISGGGGGGGGVTAVTGTSPIASSGGATPDISIAAFTGDSGSGGAKGAVPAPASGDAAAGKLLGAGGGWVAGGAGTVTHTGGALTADQPVFGAGSADVKVGTKTGNTDTVVTNTGTNVTGNTVKWDANGNLIDAGSAPGGSGTVTSVALTVPAEFSVSGSPVTTSGTLAVSKATQSANAVFAGPATGSAAAPTFRAVVPADLPLASSSAFGAVKVDGTTITAASGVISAAGGSGALVLLEQHTASSSASLDFTTCITSAYDEYVIELLNIIPATNSVNIWMRMSTNGGSSYDSGSNYFTDGGSWRAGAGFAVGGGSGTAINITAANTLTMGNDSKYGTSFTLRLYSPLSTSLYKQVIGKGFIIYQDNAIRVMVELGGQYTSLTAVNAFRILASSGNIASGIVRVYGLAK